MTDQVDPTLVRWLHDLRRDDVASVGGKNSSLGELLGQLQRVGVLVPPGFATTATAFRQFVEHNGLGALVREQVDRLHQGASLHEVGSRLRAAFRVGVVPDDLIRAVTIAYDQLGAAAERADLDVAARSSATAEDLPEASFAGQQETFLNVRGIDSVIESIRGCYASLFTDRAISYRETQGFDHLEVALSVGIQQMVRSDVGAAGVMFTLDTESGFPHVVRIDGAWGLGESVVAGEVNPDSWLVSKPLLADPTVVPILARDLGAKALKVIDDTRGGVLRVTTDAQERATWVLDDDQVLQLARWAVAIEDHYDCPMDIEWALDGVTEQLFVVQARPETVQSRDEGGVIRTHRLVERSDVLVTGRAIGSSIASGRAVVVHDPRDRDRVREGDVLVTARTDPDWVPIMKRASAIVTDLGGRTAHAAIVSRELGIPAVVGCTDATDVLVTGQDVTVSCAEGEAGQVHGGLLAWEDDVVDLAALPTTSTSVMLNVATPAAAFEWWRLPADGIGLARMEFVINEHVGVHPLALTRHDQLDPAVAAQVDALTSEYADREDYFVDRLASGLAQIAASRHPDRVIVRLSDFKTNEYADLLGGSAFEPHEENPMIGFRGASRYHSDAYRDGFALECRALRKVREVIGLRNVAIMVPFVRTVAEADLVLAELARHGLERGREGLALYMMVEVPSNVVLAEQFATRFDGFSIGSNDLTQLVLGIDRDSPELADLFDERDEAVRRMIADVIATAHEHGTTVGICGQAPSDYPEFAAFLVEQGIDSISLNPDSVVTTLPRIAEAEAARDRTPAPA